MIAWLGNFQKTQYEKDRKYKSFMGIYFLPNLKHGTVVAIIDQLSIRMISRQTTIKNRLFSRLNRPAYIRSMLVLYEISCLFLILSCARNLDMVYKRDHKWKVIQGHFANSLSSENVCSLKFMVNILQCFFKLLQIRH